MPSPSGLSAESLFGGWLARREAGEAEEFAALCREHDEQAAELGALHAQWERLERIRRELGLGGSLAERLASQYGRGVDPEVTLEGERAVTADFSAEVLARLAGRGPTTSRYRVKGEIAHGGMGAILRVWDEDLRRHLAMKVLLGRGLPSGSSAPPRADARSLARFLEEAQVTGQLDHPGIVPVHELGLDGEGRPYFTMKLVKGRTLREVFDELARGEGGWTQTRVLGLILRVCEAMSYAHAKGVIHRDLKPSNIMVGGYGEVFVMDWGLAKILGRTDEKDLRIAGTEGERSPELESDRRERSAHTPGSPLLTMDGDVVGTPAYMSPEQALGRVSEMGPPSDVYAVGAMLYHLLAGHMPYVPTGVTTSNHAVWFRVQRGPPEPLHAVAPQAPAELVAICERAMTREASARYADMSALAKDLSAFVEGRVVRAYETGAWAEARKWVVRNKPLAASLAAAVLAVTLGAVAFAIKAEEATQASLLAQQRARDALVQEQRANESAAAARRSANEAQVARAEAEASAETARLNEETAKQREVDALASDRRAQRVTEFVQEALISSDPNRGGAQEYRVTEAMDNAIRELESGALKDDSETEASLQVTISQILDGNGRSLAALRLAEKALETRQQLFSNDHADVVISLHRVASCLDSLGRGLEALPIHEEALEMCRRLFPGDHPGVATSLNNVAACLDGLGRSAEALPRFESALEMGQRLFQGDDPTVALSLNNVAACLNGLGRSTEALTKYQAALEMRQRLFKGDHPDVASSLNNVAACFAGLGHYAEALPKFEAALEMLQRLFKGDHPDVALSLNNVAMYFASIGRSAEALPRFELALGMRQRLFPGDHPDVATSLGTLARCLDSLGRSAEALPKFEGALEMRKRLFQSDDPKVALSLSNLGACLQSLGRSDEALQKYEAALDMFLRLFRDDRPEVASSINNVASCLQSLGRSAEALPMFEDALEMLKRLFPGDHPDVALSLNNVASCLLALDRNAEASTMFEIALGMFHRLVQGDHAGKATTINNAAYCLDRQGRSAEALPIYEEALEMRQRLFQGDHPDVAASLNNVALCLYSLGRSADALLYAERANEMAAKVLPEEHPLRRATAGKLQTIRYSLDQRR